MRYRFEPPPGWRERPFPPPQQGVYLTSPPDTPRASILLMDAIQPVGTLEAQTDDPLSFAMAMYGAPLMEHAGINAGPVTGASIDFFNDPTDSIGEGWLKRAGLGLGEMGAGFAVAGPLGMLPGAFSLGWNTGTAVNAYAEQEKLFGEDEKGHGLGITDWASQQGNSAGDSIRDLTGSDLAGDIAGGTTTALATVGGGIYAGGRALIDGVSSLLPW